MEKSCVPFLLAGTSEAGYTWRYAYDNANRLISATEYYSGSVVVQELNYYAVNGNRVEQDVTQSGTTTVTKFTYDLSSNVIADLNSTNGVVTRRMFLDATDSVFARIGSSGTLDFYLGDHLGSIRGLENTSGTLDDSETFDAWGNKTSESNPSNGDRYGYTGREWDTSIGLLYNRARYYDPSSGTWISQDPKGFSAGDNNLYRYVENEPSNLTDPGGLEFVSQEGGSSVLQQGGSSVSQASATSAQKSKSAQMLDAMKQMQAQVAQDATNYFHIYGSIHVEIRSIPAMNRPSILPRRGGFHPLRGIKGRLVNIKGLRNPMDYDVNWEIGTKGNSNVQTEQFPNKPMVQEGELGALAAAGAQMLKALKATPAPQQVPNGFASVWVQVTTTTDLTFETNSLRAMFMFKWNNSQSP